MKKFTFIFSLFVMFSAISMAQDVATTGSTDAWQTELPGLQDSGQYKWKSQVQAAPDGEFKKLRVTFLQNTDKNWKAGFPCVAIAEFYLYDNNGEEVALNANRFSSNATQSGEGSIASLCDGVTNGDTDKYDWYWHSQWSGTPSPYGFYPDFVY